MTDAERKLAQLATAQSVLGPGIWESESVFKSEFCEAYGITEGRLAELVKEMLAGG